MSALIAEIRLPHKLTKPTEGAFVSFVSDPSRHVSGGIAPARARTRAVARWPAKAELFRRKADVDRAEAALIGAAGLQRESRR